MRIQVRVIPRAKRAGVETGPDGILRIKSWLQNPCFCCEARWPGLAFVVAPRRISRRDTPSSLRLGLATALGLLATKPGSETSSKVTEPAQDGRANAAAVRLLAEHFQVPKAAVSILRGETSRQKLVEIGVS